MAGDEQEIVITQCGGSSIIKGQFIFSTDSKFLCCPSGIKINIYNTWNGVCLHQLKGHPVRVTGLNLTQNTFQLLSCDVDGAVYLWNYIDRILLKKFKMPLPLYGFVTVDPAVTWVMVLAKRPAAKHCCVLKYPLGRQQRGHNGVREATIESSAEVVFEAACKDLRMISRSTSGEFLAVVKSSALRVYCLRTKTHAIRLTDKDNPFTCVACHPTDRVLATGHCSGVITMWWQIFDDDKMVMSSRHWHSLQVECLSFSPGGSSLLSGGHECVLVRWQMNGEHRDFLPRLGAPIHNIAVSPDGTLTAVAHTDNVIQLVTSNNSIKLAIHGLARAHFGMKASGKRPIILVDPRTRALVTNGRPGHLQFYSVSSDTHLYNLDITCQNYVSPENLQQTTTVTDVQCAAFNTDGTWLATFESWDDGSAIPEYRLKFWFYDNKKQNYSLLTAVERPHHKQVLCLQFRPAVTPEVADVETAVSTSSDGKFRLWTLESHVTHEGVMRTWTCQFEGYHRGQPAGPVAFSHDGSLLVVAFQHVLTVWNVDEGTKVTWFTAPDCFDCITHLVFGGKSCPHLLVTGTSSHVTLWDIPALVGNEDVQPVIQWREAMGVAVMVSDGEATCVVTSQRDVYLFYASQWKLLFFKERALDNEVIGVAFMPDSVHGRTTSQGTVGSWPSSAMPHQLFRLVLLDCKQQLFCADYSEHVLNSEAPSHESSAVMERTLSDTPFAVLLKKPSTSTDTAGVAARPPGTTWYQGRDFQWDMLNPPDVPFHRILQQFINSHLLKSCDATTPASVDSEISDQASDDGGDDTDDGGDDTDDGGDDSDDDRRVISVDRPPAVAKLLNCYSTNDTLSHSAAYGRRNMTFIYYPPNHDVGDILITGSIAQTKYIFWAVRSEPIKGFKSAIRNHDVGGVSKALRLVPALVFTALSLTTYYLVTT